MTFKHVKFQDSSVMRSLERVAISKGLVAPNESITKTASVSHQADYTPSDNLMENVLKLCAALRLQNLDKQANELESKFISYKRAFNAYETSKEKGEDLIDEAHPEGSHTLKGVEGDAVIETILDQHLKNLKVVEKMPTGKLASNQAILVAVKKVLADDRQNINFQIKHNTDRITEEFSKVLDFVSKEVNLKFKYLETLENLLKNPTVQNLSDAKNFIMYANNTIKQYVSEETWNAIVKSNIFAKIVSFIQPTIDLVKKYSVQDLALELNPNTKEVTPNVTPTVVTTDPMSDFNKQVNGALNSIDQFTTAIIANPPDKATAQGIESANKWLEGKKNRILAIKQKLDSAADKSPENIAFYTKLLFEVVNKSGDSLADFRKVWL